MDSFVNRFKEICRMVDGYGPPTVRFGSEETPIPAPKLFNIYKRSVGIYPPINKCVAIGYTEQEVSQALEHLFKRRDRDGGTIFYEPVEQGNIEAKNLYYNPRPVVVEEGPEGETLWVG